MIKAHHDERDALLATEPGVYEAGWTTNSSAWVRVRLELADPDEVFELFEEAWRMTATKRAIRALDEARGAGRRGPRRRKPVETSPHQGLAEPMTENRIVQAATDPERYPATDHTVWFAEVPRRPPRSS